MPNHKRRETTSVSPQDRYLDMLEGKVVANESDLADIRKRVTKTELELAGMRVRMGIIIFISGAVTVAAVGIIIQRLMSG